MPKPRATLKQSPADFRVAEQIDFPLTGHGEHLWCYVEKTGLNTAWLKREWARLSGCAQKDIAHSGLKDRHAITRQWLSLPAKYSTQLPDSGDGRFSSASKTSANCALARTATTNLPSPCATLMPTAPTLRPH